MSQSSALLNYTRTGEGPTLIILHGLFGSSKNWQTLAKVFGRYFDVLAIDLRNHGESFHDEVMDYPSMVDDIYRLMNHLGIQSSHFIGHSMGGKVGMLFALTHPSLVSRLVVADIAPISYEHGYDDLIDPIMALNLAEMKNRSAFDQALKNDIPDMQLRHFLLQSLVRDTNLGGWRWKNNWGVIKHNIDHIIGFPCAIDSHWQVRTETLFINGENSNYVNDAAKAVIEQHFDSAHFKTLNDASHWLHAEQPELFVKWVLDFLLPRVSSA